MIRNLSYSILFIITFLAVGFYAEEAKSESTFLGASYSTINTNSVDFTGITGIVGHQFNDFLGVEGRALFSSSSESYYDSSVEIDSLYGVYLTAALPIEDSISVYVIFGHTEGDIAFNNMGDSHSKKIASTSLGFGARYFVLEAYTLFVEYLELTDEDEAVTIGARLNF